jgi:hypothetical protein
MLHQDFRSLLNYATALDQLYPWIGHTQYIYRIARINDDLVVLDDTLAYHDPRPPLHTVH